MPSPYTSRDLRRAVALSAALGSLAYVGLVMRVPDPLAILAMSASFFPFAWLLCWAFGGPVLWLVARRRRSRTVAALSGAFIAALMAGAWTTFWVAGQEPGVCCRLGGGDRIQILRGVITPYGWQVHIQSVVIFILCGALIGLMVRAAIGPGRDPTAAPPAPSR